MGPGTIQPHQVLTRWAVSQHEPLVPPEHRVLLESLMVTFASRRPEALCWWAAGVLTDVMATLPEPDPWRHMPARVADLTFGVGPPNTTGALLAGRAFGTALDAGDLVRPQGSDLLADVALAALATPLSPAGAALLAVAGRGSWTDTITASLTWFEHLWGQARASKSVSATLLAADLTGALRWASWRRKVYMGADDAWFVASAFEWSERAEVGAATGYLPASAWTWVEERVDLYRIDPGAYDELAGVR